MAADLAIISSALFLFQNYETYFCLEGHLWNRFSSGVAVNDHVLSESFCSYDILNDFEPC